MQIAEMGGAILSYGKMNTFVDLIEKQKVKDADGFVTETNVIVASFRAYYEPKHGSKKWVNRTQLFEATALFCFRAISGIKVNTDMVLTCEHGRFEITSVEDVKGRGMYIEVMAKVVV